MILLNVSLGLPGCVVVLMMARQDSFWHVRQVRGLRLFCSAGLYFFWKTCNFGDCRTIKELKICIWISPAFVGWSLDKTLLLLLASQRYLPWDIVGDWLVPCCAKCYLLKLRAFTCGIQHVDCYMQNMGKLIYFGKYHENLYLLLYFKLFELEFHIDKTQPVTILQFSAYLIGILFTYLVFGLSGVCILNTIYWIIVWCEVLLHIILPLLSKFC